MVDEKSSIKRIVAIAGIIGSLTVILLGIIAARDYFPQILVQVVVVLLLVMIIVVNGYGILGEKVIGGVKKVAKTRKEDVLAKKHFDEFDMFVDKLGDLFEPRRCDNIPYTLVKIQNKEPVFRDILLPSVDYLHDILTNV